MNEPILIKRDSTRNQKKYLTIAIVMVVTLFITSSYALLTNFDQTDNVISVSTGNLSVSINNTDTLIDHELNNKLPENDTDGLANATPITLTITNTGTMNIGMYDVKLVNDLNKTSTLDNNYIKYAISEDGTNYNVTRNLGESNNLIYRGFGLATSSSKTIYLKIWIIDTSGNNALNKEFYGSIDVKLFQKGLVEINSIEDLVDLSNSVNNGNGYANVNIELKKDLDFNNTSSYVNSQRTDYGDINGNGTVEDIKTELTNTCETCGGFPPIGNVNNRFRGDFDGKEYTIANLYTSHSDQTKESVGLFGVIHDSSIRNLTVTGTVNIIRALGEGGGIVGDMYGTSLIDNCTNYANIYSNYPQWAVGGIAGGGAGTIKISNSVNYGNISNSNNAGGVVGYNNGLMTIENCHNEGTVTNSKGQNIGGVLGRDNKATNSTTIINSYNTGDVTGNYQTLNNAKNIGGIVGRIAGGLTMKNSYNTSTVSLINSTYEYLSDIGGIIGYSEGNIVVEDSYNTGNINGGFHIGGAVGGFSQGNILLNKIHNSGIVYTTSNASNKKSVSGGLIGYTYGNSKVKILNSFNDGNITGYYNAGGMLADASECDLIAINNYNTGSITVTENVTSGFSRIANNIVSTNINNYYNLGTLNSSWKMGIAYAVSGSASKVTLANAYYLNTATTGVDGETSLNSNTTSMSLNDMKSNTFVNTLNTNISSINLSQIDSSLGDYTLSRWKLGSQGYPVFEWQ